MIVYVVEVMAQIDGKRIPGIWDLVSVFATASSGRAFAESLTTAFEKCGLDKPARVREMELRTSSVETFRPAWLVVIKRETDPPQVTPFNTEAEARAYESVHGQQWSDSFVCKVVKGPRV